MEFDPVGLPYLCVKDLLPVITPGSCIWSRDMFHWWFWAPIPNVYTFCNINICHMEFASRNINSLPFLNTERMGKVVEGEDKDLFNLHDYTPRNEV